MLLDATYLCLIMFNLLVFLEFHSCRLTSSIYSATYFLTRTRAVVRVDVEICLLLTCTSATQKNHQNNLKIIWENNCCFFLHNSVVNLTLLVQHNKVQKCMAEILFIYPAFAAKNKLDNTCDNLT